MAWVRCCGGSSKKGDTPIVNSSGQFVGASYRPFSAFTQGSNYFQYSRLNGTAGYIESLPKGYHYLVIKGYGTTALSNFGITFGSINRFVGGAGGASVTAIIDISGEPDVTTLQCFIYDHDNTSFRITEMYLTDSTN